MVVECLLAAGLKEFQISVGHAEFFSGLLEAAGISEDTEEELRNLIANKNFFGVEELIETLSLPDELNQLFLMLGNPDTGLDELARAKVLAKDYPCILNAVCNLEEIYHVLEIYDITKYISIELGLISSYQYYTGILFAGYTFGSGEAIVKGGRYDKLLTYFGKKSASIGFAVVVDQLMAALSRQKIEIPLPPNGELIIYDKEHQTDAIRKATELRKAGCCVELIAKDTEKTKDDYDAYARRNRITKITYMGE